MRTDVVGTAFDDFTLEEAVQNCMSIIESGGKGYIATPNPEIVMLAKKSAALAAALENAAMVLADGVGITIGAKIIGRPLRARIPGIDFMSAVFEKMAASGKSVFLFGAKPGIAEKAGERLAEKYGLLIAGTADGYFTDSEHIINKVNEAAPDVLVVCLGAPKQELWMAENLERLNVKVCVGLGGALDVYSGEVKRAPAAFRKMGLEWFYRLITDPRRIKRMIKLPVFIFLAIGQKIRG